MLTSLALAMALSMQTPAPAPPPVPRIRLADYLPPLADANRSFEETRAFLQRNGEDDLPWTPPQVEMTAGEDMSGFALSVAFNWVWLGEGDARWPVWFARLRAMSRTGAIERFADSRTCPGLEASLRQLDALPPIDPRVPGLPDPVGPPDPTDLALLNLHDNSYGIRLRGLSEGGVYSDRLAVNGGSTAVFAPVIADSLRRLKPCWTETPLPRA
ncbi:hypothetical protein N0B44_26425 [Roseibacterium beibuensis]|uniref:hypothetical protein n=1 Tax=[Roseibacterium] beibuensis TaxID=1193142 RepID=UPI00217CC89C|nr:hypothetical protein [Roseibacterium beibuensis]MCS6626463.1 hypothetical protein [Roseibacterium beibuensis]